MAARDPEVQVLLDKQAIHEVVLRYCRGVDRCDRDLVRDCYWPEAIDEHGSFTGTRDEYLEWLFGRMLPRYSMTMHFIGNVLVEVDVTVCDRADKVAMSATFAWFIQQRERPSRQ